MLAVHVIPSGEVMARLVPVLDTAQKRPSSGDQQIDVHTFAAGAVREVHVLPSGDVITLPSFATAQNSFSAGAHATELHVLFRVTVGEVHFQPALHPFLDWLYTKASLKDNDELDTEYELDFVPDRTRLIFVFFIVLQRNHLKQLKTSTIYYRTP